MVAVHDKGIVCEAWWLMSRGAKAPSPLSASIMLADKCVLEATLRIVEDELQ